MEPLLYLLIAISLPLIGLVVGRANERNHLRSLLAREAACNHVLVLTTRRLPESRPVQDTQVAIGSVVIAVDHFKMFLSSWRALFGGEMKSYITLIDRARREALLRMRESAPDADLFLNLRFETADIGGKAKGAPNVEMLAYATAVRFRR